MTKVNTSNRTETKSHIFPYVIFKSEIIFPSLQNTKKKNEFHNCHLSISLQKGTSKVK